MWTPLPLTRPLHDNNTSPLGTWAKRGSVEKGERGEAGAGNFHRDEGTMRRRRKNKNRLSRGSDNARLQ